MYWGIEMAIEKELEYFNKNLDEWLNHYENKYALIYNEKLVDTFTTEDEAYKKGIEKFGEVDILVRLIIKNQPVAKTPALFAGVVIANPQQTIY